MRLKQSCLALATLVAGLGIGASALAGPVTTSVLDPFTSLQTVTATVGSPSVSSTVAAPESFFGGNRTLTADLTSPSGSVEAVVGGGTLDCNRSVLGGGGCGVFWEVLSDVYLQDITYGAISDGAFGGSGTISFLWNDVVIASELIATGAGIYTSGLGFLATAGGVFGLLPQGTTAIDTSLTDVTITHGVPEPGSLALAGLAMTGLVLSRRRNKT